MYDPKSLADRTEEARAAARFAHISQRDREGRVRVVEVPGHDMAHHRIIIRHEVLEGKKVLSAECAKEAGAAGWIPCNGNLHGVCYHAMAAVIIAACDAGYEVRFTKDVPVARKLKNFGDTPVPLYSWQNKRVSPLYVSMRRQEVDQEAA
jgi:hypothetical protein